MKITAKIVLDRGALAQIQKAAEASLPQVLDALSTEIQTAAVVPKDTGALEQSASVFAEAAAGGISWDTPYARRLFFNPQYNFSQDKNANARGRWTDHWQFGEGQSFLTQALLYFLRANSGGLVK